MRGKIAVRFGAPRSGERSDGISIAVPEGTPIEAADDGVVVYAGNGLQSFGNLVIVRHADDYVTVYAHAKELSVKRGDQARRGDVIGASGETGNTGTPRLYFEIRKNSAPVDPLSLLERRIDPTQRNASSGATR